MFALPLLAATGHARPVFAAEGTPAAGSAASSEPVTWDWTASRRYLLETQVHLPLFMWFVTPYNHQARVTAFDLRMISTCAPGEPLGRKRYEVVCTLDDVALSAAGMEQEEGLLQPILDELDEILTGAAVQLQVRPDGRLANIDLEDVDRRNQRVGRMNENLRLVVSRAFAGFDLPLPVGAENAWPQYDVWLMRAPSADGSTGASEIVHAVRERSGGLMWLESGGRGTIFPGEGENKYDASFSGTAVFDTVGHRLVERTWMVAGTPTASSSIALGTEGYPYLQQGRIQLLSEGQSWDVGPSRELTPAEAAQTAIQQTRFLGTNPLR